MRSARVPVAALAGALVLLGLTTAPAALAVSPAPTVSPGSGAPAGPGATPGSGAAPGPGASLGPAESIGAASAAARLDVGGVKMASPGVVVNYPAGGPKLPSVPASA